MLQGYSGPGIMSALLGAKNAEKANEIVENLRVTTGSIRQVTTRINQDDWPRWSDRIDDVMTWATAATDKIDAVLDEGQALLTDTRAVVTVNRPKIDTTMDNVVVASDNIAGITDRMRSETVDKINALLDKGQEGVDSAANVLERLDNDYTFWRSDIREALAGARQTAQQLKLTSIEVRRSPWKLLYRPKQTELEHELLYEAARSFALAVSDLKAAAASTERLVENHADEIGVDPEVQDRIREFLEGSINRYEDAQQRLIDVLLAE